MELSYKRGRVVLKFHYYKLILPPDNYLATYSKRVTGKIVGSKIVGLSGIKVKALFQWWGITGIKVSGENLVFEVGSLSAKYPSKNFDEVPNDSFVRV
ncbi:hypothetical protein CTI12_AA252390 [Artemisia annua]|uniref:Uncharacterized protein n=1 Tax=Artemisia annua TaxID=35608 RepID=A0A2U1NJB6_ARTAN|nr:hypothetical protein CTI12_AA252390 [Artemisia annua]